MTHYAMARMTLLRNAQAMRRAGEHGARRDESAAKAWRDGADSERRAVGWTFGMAKPVWIATTPNKTPLPTACDYLAAHKRMCAAKGARERKKSALAIHILIMISPAWLAETGGIHDPENPRVKALRRQAWVWAEYVFGSDSVIGLRMDLDEMGGGVVDIIVAPIHPMKHGRSPEKVPTISCNRGLEELARARDKEPTSLKAGTNINDSWAEWAAAQLDAALSRGDPAAETGREHIAPAAYRKKMAALEAEEARLQARLAAMRKHVGDLVEWAREWAEFVRETGDMLPAGHFDRMPPPEPPAMPTGTDGEPAGADASPAPGG